MSALTTYPADTDLSDIMDFDHVITVHEDGSITDASDLYAPECYWEGWGERQHIEPGCGWVLMNGYSGQDRYPGPIMHPSELIAGLLADDIRENPGHYVAVACYLLDDDDVVGWAVACRALDM